MGVQDAVGDLRNERGIVREREANRLGESAFDAGLLSGPSRLPEVSMYSAP